VGIKDFLPVLLPPFSVEAAKDKYPLYRIMSGTCRRPWPNHVWMDPRQKEIWILRIRDPPMLESVVSRWQSYCLPSV
jgi:hypothetical protein